MKLKGSILTGLAVACALGSAAASYETEETSTFEVSQETSVNVLGELKEAAGNVVLGVEHVLESLGSAALNGVEHVVEAITGTGEKAADVVNDGLEAAEDLVEGGRIVVDEALETVDERVQVAIEHAKNLQEAAAFELERLEAQAPKDLTLVLFSSSDTDAENDVTEIQKERQSKKRKHHKKKKVAHHTRQHKTKTNACSETVCPVVVESDDNRDDGKKSDEKIGFFARVARAFNKRRLKKDHQKIEKAMEDKMLLEQKKEDAIAALERQKLEKLGQLKVAEEQIAVKALDIKNELEIELTNVDTTAGQLIVNLQLQGKHLESEIERLEKDIANEAQVRALILDNQIDESKRDIEDIKRRHPSLADQSKSVVDEYVVLKNLEKESSPKAERRSPSHQAVKRRRTTVVPRKPAHSYFNRPAHHVGPL